ncbi:unnamed protein product [Larinioides sclopetarius]|uniref:Uncharacterized protein n=1 Tax=Larinioides sclopetarius TaxID=280406 RepID=A0AAV2AC24_9ARAC
MVFCIEKFSTYLCLVQSTDLCAYGSEFESTDRDKLVVFILMMKLREMYGQEIRLAVDKIFSIGDTFFFRSFFRAILSRCIKLSKNVTYLHFMLASTFVKQVVSANFCATKCFTLPKIASLALIAAYKRCYTDYFNIRRESKTLESYCFILNSVLSIENSTEGRKYLSPFAELEIGTLMASLNDVDDINFELTDNEEKMLNGIFLETCSEDLIKDDVETVSRQSELLLSLEDTDSENTIEYSLTDDNASFKNLCEFCGFNCTKFVLEVCITSV